MVIGLTALVAVGGVGATLAVREPWVDRTPFTARSYSVLGAALFVDEGNGTCHAKSAASRKKLLGEDKQVLATGHGQGGEILSSEYGYAAGDCLAYTAFTGVPAGEDAYFLSSDDRMYTADGKGVGPTEESEIDLRQSLSEAKEGWLDFRASTG
ncbi:hypothetical protein ACIQ9M_15435 [Streptomyces californicus]|uniref:hypothetical protein n=1 Tax=Streptomyces TaxID=1883 RepID=UPI00342CDA57